MMSGSSKEQFVKQPVRRLDEHAHLLIVEMPGDLAPLKVAADILVADAQYLKGALMLREAQ